MEYLIMLGLTVAVLIAAISSLFRQRPQRPQIIYVQPAPLEPDGSGCLPLIILIAFILFALRLA